MTIYSKSLQVIKLLISKALEKANKAHYRAGTISAPSFSILLQSYYKNLVKYKMICYLSSNESIRPNNWPNNNLDFFSIGLFSLLSDDDLEQKNCALIKNCKTLIFYPNISTWGKNN